MSADLFLLTNQAAGVMLLGTEVSGMSHEVSQRFSALGSKSLEHSLKLYSVAAVTAGVSVLALVQPAASEVVVTKKTIAIPIWRLGEAPVKLPLSLTNNGVNEFSFSLYSFAYHSAFRDLTVIPVQGGAVEANTSNGGNRTALALARGAKIGPSAQFGAVGTAFVEESHANFGYTAGGNSFYTKTYKGNWAGNPKDRYLGVRFLINGQTHYGWVRLTVTTAPHGAMSATITAYAYETVTNKKIFAGVQENTAANVPNTETGKASIGMLALGADGLAIWRKETTSN
jgi:hypothetical protein